MRDAKGSVFVSLPTLNLYSFFLPHLMVKPPLMPNPSLGPPYSHTVSFRSIGSPVTGFARFLAAMSPGFVQKGESCGVRLAASAVPVATVSERYASISHGLMCSGIG